MSVAMLAVAALLALLSAAITTFIRRNALAAQRYDMPNQRSSHTVPTPRGGGGAIVLVSLAGFLVAGAAGRLDSRLLFALCAGGGGVALVGYLDDLHGLSAGFRLIAHMVAGFVAVFCLGGLPSIRVAGHALELGHFGYLVGALAIVWTLNLFNFMDGIDGIAGSEAVFIASAASVLGSSGLVADHLMFGELVLAAAALGFLVWNWPPAKIFMGDVGSGYLGYSIGVLALAATREDPTALWIWLILGGVFFTDATVTLVRRVVRGERVYEAHRSHAYQWLSRRWGGHRPVTILVLLVNVLWLLPCAVAAALYPTRAVWIALSALLPLAALVLVAGAGRSEHHDSIQINTRQ